MGFRSKRRRDNERGHHAKEKHGEDKSYSGSGRNYFTSPAASLFISGASDEWVQTAKPALDLEIKKECLEEYFRVPAGVVVVVGVPIVEKTFDEPEIVEVVWVQAKIDAAMVIEIARHAAMTAAIVARFPGNANAADRQRSLYDESLKVIDNEAKIALKRSDFEKEFNQLKDAREKRKKEHNENLAKCLKTMTSKIGLSILMRVDELIQANRWRQAYYDLDKILAGSNGGHEHKEAIFRILNQFTWDGKRFDDFINELNRLFEQVLASGWPVNDELRVYHLKQAIYRSSHKIFNDLLKNYEYQVVQTYGDLISRLQQKWAVYQIEKVAKQGREELHVSEVTPDKKSPRRERLPEAHEKVLVLSAGNPNREHVCKECGRKGHLEKDCWTNATCKNCGKKGHVMSHCPEEKAGATAGAKGRDVRFNVAEEEPAKKVKLGDVFKKKYPPKKG